MKVLLAVSLMISSAGFAQTIDLAGFKSLLTQRQATLENVHVTMTKVANTSGKVMFESGECAFSMVATQSILKFEGERMIILSTEKTTPLSAACEAGGMKAFEQKILYYAAKPSLKEELKALDTAAPTVQSIERSGDIVTMNMSVVETNDGGENRTSAITVKYNLTKSAFDNLISQQDTTSSMNVTTVSDINLRNVDLKNVFFCANNDGKTSDCVQGDFSDILF